MSENKWNGLGNEEYEIQDLGRPAVFFLPSYKLKANKDGRTVEDDLHEFLISNFGAFTNTNVPYFGFWRDNGAKIVYDECRMYEVAFAGKDRLPLLIAKLAQICKLIGEECIYFKAGQYACTIHPQ